MLKKISKNCDECDIKDCNKRRKYGYNGIKASKRKFQKSMAVFGADTETCNGEPMTIQFYDGENGNVRFVDKKNVIEKFLSYLSDVKLPAHVNTAVVFFHNLEFDFPILLFPITYKFFNDYFKICGCDCRKCRKTPNNCGFEWIEELKPFNCMIDVKCNRVFFGKITFYSEGSSEDKKPRKVRRRVYIRDSLAFMRYSLAYLAEELNLGIKFPTPPGLGEKDFSTVRDGEKEYFMKYAVNDAVLEYKLANYLLEFHKEFDVPLACSAPNFAQKVFTKHFYPKQGKTYLPNKGVWDACALSYHGGKNNFTLKYAQRRENVLELDVNSMYPYAMISLPAWTSGDYQKVFEIDYEHAGIYCVSGIAKRCDWPIIPDHEFKYFNDKEFNDVWIASYELIEAIRCKEIEIKNIWGYVFIPDEKAVNPFKDYVDYFFKKKSGEKNAKRFFFKLLLNSLYGKFCQSVRCNGDIDSISSWDEDPVTGEFSNLKISQIEKIWRAGGLCHLFIATLITSFTRAHLHALEHKYRSLDCATDSIKTEIRPDSLDLGLGIGELSLKSMSHHAYLIRNKVYVFFDGEKQQREGLEFVEGHGNVIHSARHGFHGPIKQLISMFENKQKTYKFKRMVKLKEARISIKGLKAFTMHEFDNVAFNIKYLDDFDLNRGVP
jgi:hypothetical protein